MKYAFRHCITVALLLYSLTPVVADTSFDAPGNYNPIVPGYFADPTLKKFGDTFYLYATTDGNGEHWNDLPGSPVERQDMAGLPVQVGLYHASYGGESSFVSFRQFRITVSKQTE